MSDDTNEQSSDYLTLVLEHFIKERNSVFWISPRDIIHVVKWEAKGIPLSVVMKAITAAFQKKSQTESEQETSVRSIGYCEKVIVEEWKEYLSKNIGKPESSVSEPVSGVVPLDEPVCAHIRQVYSDGLSDELGVETRQHIAEALDTGLQKLRNSSWQESDDPTESLRKQLQSLDDRLMKIVIAELLPETLQQLMEQSQEQLNHFGVYGRSDEIHRAYRNVFKSLLRQRYGLSKLISYVIF